MNNFNKENFAKILEKIKKTYSSLNEMAKKTDITSSYISRFLALKFDTPPSPEILKKIAINSNNVISYMDLLQICGYIDYQNIFEYYYKTFTLTKLESTLKKSEIFDTDETEEIIRVLENSNMDYLYTKLKNKPIDLQIQFFNVLNNNYKKTLDSKSQIIENVEKIPVIDKISQDIIVQKNKNLKINYTKQNIKEYVYFSNSYIKRNYDYVATKMNDNSMNYKINKGNILLIQIQDNLKNGDLGVVQIDNDIFIRKYINNNDYICLESLTNNENYITGIYNTKKDNIKILGKVIAYQGKI